MHPWRTFPGGQLVGLTNDSSVSNLTILRYIEISSLEHRFSKISISPILVLKKYWVYRPRRYFENNNDIPVSPLRYLQHRTVQSCMRHTSTYSRHRAPNFSISTASIHICSLLICFLHKNNFLWSVRTKYYSYFRDHFMHQRNCLPYLQHLVSCHVEIAVYHEYWSKQEVQRSFSNFIHKNVPTVSDGSVKGSDKAIIQSHD